MLIRVPRLFLSQVNNPPANPDLSARYPHQYWAISDKKTYCECLRSWCTPMPCCLGGPMRVERTARLPMKTITHRSALILSRHAAGTTAGTAILSKIAPLSVDYTLPGHPSTSAVKGRIVTLEFASCYVVGTYVVNAGTGLKVRL